MRHSTISLLLFCALFLGCEETRLNSQVRAVPPNPKSAEEFPLPHQGKQTFERLQPISATFENFELPSAEFKQGEVSLCESDSVNVEKTQGGFVVKMRSGSPIPTPTVIDGYLYASGGFSSKEYYCLNATTGEFVWGAELSDDGPSMAVTTDDSVIFNTESCTIFAIQRQTGKCLWSHYMGDPMMGAPAVSGDRVFTVYPATPKNDDQPPPAENPAKKEDAEEVGRPTYVLACLDAKSGEVIWRHWLDGDCVSAPVPTDDDVLVATLPGTLYRFDARHGKLIGSWHARATSMPVLAQGTLLFTRRTDAAGTQQAPYEAIVKFDMHLSIVGLLAANKAAPYLDRAVQEGSEATKAANSFEKSNGIGGGFGGGFFAVEDTAPTDDSLPTAPAAEKAVPDDTMPLDALGQQQQRAADNLGLGNVSTLQSYRGSQILNVGNRNVNCMGDEIVCTSTSSGKTLWTRKLPGNLEKRGGHLGAPPILAEGDLFIAAVDGSVLRLRPEDGSIKATYQVGSELRFSPVVVDGRLYVSTQDGKIVCLKLSQ